MVCCLTNTFLDQPSANQHNYSQKLPSMQPLSTLHMHYQIYPSPSISELPQCSINVILACHQHCSACLSSGCHAQSMTDAPWNCAHDHCMAAHCTVPMVQALCNVATTLSDFWGSSCKPPTNLKQIKPRNGLCPRPMITDAHGVMGIYACSLSVNQACKGLQIILRVF